MQNNRFLTGFAALTRCIFTVITAEALWLLSLTGTAAGNMTEAILMNHIPECLEHLGAAVVLYLLMAAGISLALKENPT